MDQKIERRIEAMKVLLSSSKDSDMQQVQLEAQILFQESKKANDNAGIAFALFAQGRTFMNLMQIKESLEKLEEARKHAVLSRARETEVRCISGMGLCLMFQQNYEEALEYFLEYMRLYYEYKVGTKYYAVLNNVGEIFRLLGKYDTALQYYLEAQEVCDSEDHSFLWVLKANIANTHIKLGDADQAKRYLQEVQEIGELPKGSHFERIVHQSYGHLDRLTGDLAGAEKKLNEVLAFYREQPYFAVMMEQNFVYEDLYEIYMAQERWAKGEDLLLEAVEYAKKNQMWPLHIHYLGLLAKHFEESHEATKAYDTLRKFYNSQTKFEKIRQARKLRNIELRIELDQLRKEKTELHSISHLDRLTGIYNRRAMQEDFEQLVRGEVAMESEMLAAMLLDVDYFKEFNDQYGHLEGDHCLQRIAEALQGLAEEFGGKIYRYGGDEFLLIVEESSKKACEQLAKELPKRIEALRIPHDHSYVSQWISVSAGLLCAGRTVFEDFSKAFLQLDEALYVAKRKGRNRVELMNV